MEQACVHGRLGVRSGADNVGVLVGGGPQCTPLPYIPSTPLLLSWARPFHAQGHLLSVANLTLHPFKPILVTASDDKTWKMWHMPGGDLIMCGEGHKVRPCSMACVSGPGVIS